MTRGPVPGWFSAAGWVMIAVGAVGLGYDATRLGDVSAAAGVFEVLLDVFLLGGGALVVLITRRAGD